MEKLLKQLIDDLENTTVSLAALERVVFQTVPLASGEYRNQLEIERAKLKSHFDGLRLQTAALHL